MDQATLLNDSRTIVVRQHQILKSSPMNKLIVQHPAKPQVVQHLLGVVSHAVLWAA